MRRSYIDCTLEPGKFVKMSIFLNYLISYREQFSLGLN